MADIQSAAAEIRRGIKRKKEEQTTAWKYIWSALLHRATIKYYKSSCLYLNILLLRLAIFVCVYSARKVIIFHFYSAPQCSHCKRCTSYSISVCLPVCLSVRLSHASIVSKRRYVARCSLHCQIANASSFVETKTIFPRDDSFPLKSWHKLTYPLLIAASLDTFCLVAPHRYELTKTKFNYDE